MCSVKCARPAKSSGSSSEPTLICRARVRRRPARDVSRVAVWPTQARERARRLWRCVQSPGGPTARAYVARHGRLVRLGVVHQHGTQPVVQLEEAVLELIRPWLYERVMAQSASPHSLLLCRGSCCSSKAPVLRADGAPPARCSCSCACACGTNNSCALAVPPRSRVRHAISAPVVRSRSSIPACSERRASPPPPPPLPAAGGTCTPTRPPPQRSQSRTWSSGCARGAPASARARRRCGSPCMQGPAHTPEERAGIAALTQMPKCPPPPFSRLAGAQDSPGPQRRGGAPDRQRLRLPG